MTLLVSVVQRPISSFQLYKHARSKKLSWFCAPFVKHTGFAILALITCVGSLPQCKCPQAPVHCSFLILQAGRKVAPGFR